MPNIHTKPYDGAASHHTNLLKLFIKIESNDFRYMESKEPTVFTSTYAEGMKRVLKGNFAFLCESSMLDYVVQRDCNLTQIGGLVDSKGYGIATPKGSRWKDRISQAILYLQEKSSIQVTNKISRNYREAEYGYELVLHFLTYQTLETNISTISRKSEPQRYVL